VQKNREPAFFFFFLFFAIDVEEIEGFHSLSPFNKKETVVESRAFLFSLSGEEMYAEARKSSCLLLPPRRDKKKKLHVDGSVLPSSFLSSLREIGLVQNASPPSPERESYFSPEEVGSAFLPFMRKRIDARPPLSLSLSRA